MGADPVLEQLELAEGQLQAEVDALPQIAMLVDIKRLVEQRRFLLGLRPEVSALNAAPLATVDIRPRSLPRAGSRAAQVVALTQDYLRQRMKRAQSAEILGFLRLQDVDLPSTNPVATVAAYLSSSDIFDNVRGEGYGLVEWAMAPAPATAVSALPSESSETAHASSIPSTGLFAADEEPEQEGRHDDTA